MVIITTLIGILNNGCLVILQIIMYQELGKLTKILQEHIKRYKIFLKIKDIYKTEKKSILVPKDNRKQNPDESYASKYQKHVACNYGYVIMVVWLDIHIL